MNGETKNLPKICGTGCFFGLNFVNLRQVIKIRTKQMERFFAIIALGTALAATLSAQARFTSSTRMQHLGQIEWKHPVTVQYTVTNTGDEPLVLSGVEPDCACTAARWTEAPIAPGGKGTVDVTFDAEALGHFQKSVAIFTNASSLPVYLEFDGEVVTEVRDFTRTHPYLVGQIRIDRNEINFPDVQRGEHPVVCLSVVNLSDEPYEPVLMHLPPYMEMKAEPEVLQQGERGTLTLTLDSEKLTDLGLTQSSVYLARFMGDKVSEENELPVSAVVLPDFSGLTETERLNAPAIRLSALDVNLSGDLAKKARAQRDITVTNAGRSPLQIGKIQVFHPAVGVSLKKTVLAPGESTRLRVSVTKKNIGRHRRRLRLLLITNDPAQPKTEINIKAE